MWKSVICHHTTEYRGDHSKEVQIFHETIEGETVEAMVKRIHLRPMDYITIYVVMPPDNIQP